MVYSKRQRNLLLLFFIAYTGYMTIVGVKVNFLQRNVDDLTKQVEEYKRMVESPSTDPTHLKSTGNSRPTTRPASGG